MTTYFESTGARDVETASAYDADLAAARAAEEQAARQAAQPATEVGAAQPGTAADAAPAAVATELDAPTSPSASGASRAEEAAPGYEAAFERAQEAGGAGPLDGFIERIAERVGGKASVRAVFGDPIERDGITVIPVARVRWGFGGGAGSGPVPVGPGRPEAAAMDGATSAGGPTEASGTGGGGGATADPVGYLEIGPDGATFQPILSPRPSPAFLLAAGATAALVLGGLARLIRR